MPAHSDNPASSDASNSKHDQAPSVGSDHGHSGQSGDGQPLVDPQRQAYEGAQSAYQKELGQYWQGAEATKHAHQKVSDFPPAYHGPEKPAGYEPPKTTKILPSVNDMVKAWDTVENLAVANKNLPALSIDETSESNFKKAYAREVIDVGGKHGLSQGESKNIAKNIYAFEDGGRGTADMLSGVPMRLTDPDAPGSHANQDARREYHPLSTAMGYNQLLMATSLRFVDGSKEINNRLDQLAKNESASGTVAGTARGAEIEAKIKNLDQVQSLVHKEVMAMGQTDKAKYLDTDGNPNYALYTDFAKSTTTSANGLTGREMTSAVQALNLDKDLGPVLQAEEFGDVLAHSLKPSFQADLQTKANNDAINAQKFDHLTPAEKEAAISEVLDRSAAAVASMTLPSKAPHDATAGGAASSPIAGPTARDILAHAFDAYAKDDTTPLTEAALGTQAYELLTNKVLALKKRGEESGPLSPVAANLVDKLFHTQMHGPSAEDYLPAAAEFGNLAGGSTAERALMPQNADDSTVNYFNQSGYQGNPIVRGRSADELVKAIYRNMHGKNGSADNYGMADMIKAFDSQ